MGLFGDLKYDLAHNKINFQIESLKQHSLTLFIEKLCRDGVITEYINKNIEKIRGSKVTNDNFTIANELAELLTKNNIYESAYFSTVNLYQFRTFIKETVCFVVMQIYDLLRKETVAKEEEKNVSFLLKNITITKQGTIDLMNTVHRILRREQLLPSHSCELACYYFITDEIVNNHYEMVTNETSDYFVGHKREEAVKKYLDFWKCFILKFDMDYLKFILQDTINMNRKLSNDKKREIFADIFEEALRRNNEIAVHYLWNYYVSKVKEQKVILRKALRNYIFNPLHVNINMFLLFQIESNELDKRFKSKYVDILINVVRNVRWHSLFAMALKELKIYLDIHAFRSLLNALSKGHFIDFSSQINITIEYINSLPNNVKEIMSKQPTYIYQHSLTKPFVYAKKDLVTSILSLGNKLDLKDFLSSDSGMDLIAEAIKKGNFEFVDNFLLELFRQDDIIEMKKNLYYGKRETLFKHFMKIRQFQKLKEVIDWLSAEISESVHDFKEQMLSQHNGLHLKQMIFPPNDIDPDINPFPSVDDFLFWCFESDEAVSLFKRKIFLCSDQTLTGPQNLISCYDELRTSILKSKWNLLEKFFNWKNFGLNEKQSFHQELLHDYSFHLQVIVEARNSMYFLEPYSNFLERHLVLDNSAVNYIKRKMLYIVIIQNPEVARFIREWYQNKMSMEQLLISIANSEIPFQDHNMLNWLNPHDMH